MACFVLSTLSSFCKTIFFQITCPFSPVLQHGGSNLILVCSLTCHPPLQGEEMFCVCFDTAPCSAFRYQERGQPLYNALLFRIYVGTFHLKLIQERKRKGWAAPCTNWCYQFGYSLQIVAAVKYTLVQLISRVCYCFDALQQKLSRNA